MAHFAELDATNTVLRVLVVHNEMTTIDGVEVEQNGIDFLAGLFPGSGTWVQCSYNDNMRARFAGIGYTYDADLDVFIQPQPFPSWTLNADTTVWEPPTPNTNLGYTWDEDTTSWVTPPSPFPSWVWDADGGRWEAPTPYPDDGPLYEWDEGTTSWVEVTE